MWNTKLAMNRLIYHARSPSRVEAKRPVGRVVLLTASLLFFECLHHLVVPVAAAMRRFRGITNNPSALIGSAQTLVACTGMTCEGVL